MSGFLTEMRQASQERVRQAMMQVPLAAVVRAAHETPGPGPVSASVAGFDVIAEVKRSSPSQGALSSESDIDLIHRAVSYAQAGALAVSVLTEPTHFDGNMEHLRSIASALRPLGVPAMRKDFLVSPYQVWEAAAAGAGGVLLIIRILDDHEIMEMLEAAAQAKLFVLLEAFDENDLQRATPFVGVHKRVVVGLNSRDLQTLKVSFDRLIQLVDHFPPDCLRVAESGIATPADAADAARAGYQIALIGTALMQSSDPKKLVSDLLVAGREATQW